MAARVPRSRAARPIACRCVIVGDAKVGKTTYIHRVKNDVYDGRYVQSLRTEVTTVRLEKGLFADLVDINTPDRTQQNKDSQYRDAQCVLIMCTFSPDGKPMFGSLQKWHSEIRKVSPDVPIVVVLNKREYSPKYELDTTTVVNEEELRVICMSLKSDTKQRIQSPLRYLADKAADLLKSTQQE